MLLAKPKMLLLDEPTASMDLQLEAQVMDHLFHEVDKKAVVIMATHKAGAMKHVNRVLVMEAGRVVLDGPKEKVMEEINRQAAKRRTN